MNRLSRLTVALLGTLTAILVTGCGGPNLIDRVGSGFWGYGICGSILLILDIIALVEIAGSNWTFGRKALWAALIVFFPVGGLLLYWVFARGD